MVQLKNLKLIFILLAAIFVLVGIYLALIYSPTHATMGDVQRIFYFHVASAWVAYLAFGVTFVACIIFLKTNATKWDIIAAASAEIGVVYCTLAITTGPLWAKAVWGVFWIWEDIKLFMTLVLWLVFISYLALRTNIHSKTQRANLSAVFGIIGFICIPLSFAANRIWVQFHPTIIATSQGSLQGIMAFSLVIAVIGFTFLYFYLLFEKVELERMREVVEEVKIRIGG